MLRGCVFALVLYGVLAAAYFAWLDTEFGPPETYIGAGVLGFLVLCCIGALSNAFRDTRDRRLISAGRHDLPPRDGRTMAAVGGIYPVSQPLIAPFSGAKCVICEYDLARAGRAAEAEHSGSDYAGFLMTSSVIRTRTGETRLLGFPLLEGFAEKRCQSADAVRNARAFLASTQFEDRTGAKLATIFSVFGDVWSDEDGSVAKNLQIRHVDPEELLPGALEERIRSTNLPDADDTDEDDLLDSDAEQSSQADDDELGDEWENEVVSLKVPKMTEKRVAVGEMVCAIGTYDELRHGLIPPGRGRNPNRLIRGSAEQVEQKLRGSARRHLIGGLLALVIIHGAVYGLMQAHRHSLQAKDADGQRD